MAEGITGEAGMMDGGAFLPLIDKGLQTYSYADGPQISGKGLSYRNLRQRFVDYQGTARYEYTTCFCRPIPFNKA